MLAEKECKRQLHWLSLCSLAHHLAIHQNLSKPGIDWDVCCRLLGSVHWLSDFPGDVMLLHQVWEQTDGTVVSTDKAHALPVEILKEAEKNWTSNRSGSEVWRNSLQQLRHRDSVGLGNKKALVPSDFDEYGIAKQFGTF
jgi:hypothetical protein